MLLASLVLLQTAPAACPTPAAALPANLAGWTQPATAFGIGQAVELQAGDAAKLPGVPTGAKPGGAVMIGFKVETAGSYGIALDQGGWIDVVPGVAGGEAIKSVKHGHGPQCSGIRKIVRFDLQPGLYRIYLTGLTKPTAKLMLVAPD